MTLGLSIVTCLIIGIGAGIASGLFGVGGGIIIVPLLIWWLGVPHLQANGLSLVALSLPIGLFSAYQYYKNGYLQVHQIKWGLWISVGLILGSILGSRLVPYIHLTLLKRLFGLILFWGAIRLWFFDSK